MAQIIKQKRGSLEKLSSVTGSLQKGELVIATGSVKLANVTNGEALVFATYESGAVKAVNRVLKGGVAPIFSGSTYNGMLDGVPFYASASNTLFLLGSDTNDAIDLTGNISEFSSSVSASIANLSSSIQSVTGDFSSSVATSFSSSKAEYTSFSASAASDLNSVSGAFATSVSASDAAITSLSASVASVTGDFSSSVATSFSASAANVADLSASVSSISGAFATSTSASNASIASLSASVASVTGDFSSSVATSFSASAASVTDLSASIALTDNSQTDRLDVIESTYATTGSNTFVGTQTITGSLYITNDLVVYGSSSLLNVTASAVSIGTNTVVLNTANPAIRFGGIEVIDSGSSQSTGSLLWDSENNVWLYANPVGAAYGSARLIAGPQNTGSLGDEIGLTIGYVPVAVGDDHIGDSIISASATKVTIEGDLDTTGNISASTISGIGNVTAYSTSVDSRVATLETSLGGGGSIGSRVAGLEALTGSYATTGSNTFTDGQTIQGNIIIESNGQIRIESDTADTLFGMFDGNDILGAYYQMWGNNHATADLTQRGSAEFVFDTRNGGGEFRIVEYNGSTWTKRFRVDRDGNTQVTGSLFVSTDISGSTLNGIGNVTEYSTSVDSRLGTIETSIGGGGSLGTRVGNLETISASYLDFTQSYYTDSASFATADSASNATREALSQSVYDTLFWPSTGLSASLASGSQYNVNVYSASVYDSVFGASGLSSSVSSSFGELSGSVSSSISALSSSIGELSGSVSSSIAELSSSVSQSIYDNISALSQSIASASAAESYSIDARLTSIEFLDTTFATTGSNYFLGDQSISGSLSTSGSIFVKGIQNREYGSATQVGGNSFIIDGYGSNVLIQGGNNSESIKVGNIGGAGTGVRIQTESGNGVSFVSTDIQLSKYTIPGGITPVSETSGGLQISASNQTVVYNLEGPTFQGRFVQIATSQSLYEAVTASVEYSSSAATAISASNFEIAQLSASVASVTGDFSSSVATSFSASIAEYTAFSASAASELNTLSSSVATSLSASTAEYTSFSASAASELNTLSSSAATSLSASKAEYTSFSASAASELNTLSSSVATDLNTLSSSIYQTDVSQSSRVEILEDHLVAFDQAIELTGSQVTIVGNLVVKGTTTSVESTTVNIGDNIIELNGTGATNGGLYVKDPTSPNTETGSLLWDTTNDYWVAGVKFSESKVLVAEGDNVVSSSVQITLDSTTGFTAFDTAISTSFSASNASIASLSASVASVTGDFSSSVATSFSASAFNLTELSASVSSLSASVATDLNSVSGAIATSLSASTAEYTSFSASAASELNSVSGAFATSVSASTAEYTAFSASAASDLNSVSGAFATSTSASNAAIASLSASVASVTGDFSSSVATSFSASAFNLTELSASIYLTDATQSADITNNSSSFATEISASNFRITILETTIDGGSY